MSKSDKNKAKEQISQNQDWIKSENVKNNDMLNSILGRAQGNATDLYPGVKNNFQELYDTGGIKDTEADSMRRHVAEGVKGIYSNAQDDARRAIAGTGGYGNPTASLTRAAREGANAEATAVTGVDSAIAGMRQGGRIAGAQGLSSLYGMNTQQMMQTAMAIIENYRATGQLSQQDLQMLTEISKQPGLFGNIMNAIQVAGGAAAGVMGGIGAIKH